MDQFADIRPYNDDEVRPVIDNLLVDKEFIAAVAGLGFGAWHKSFKWLIYPLVRRRLRGELQGVDSVDAFQHVVKKYMDSMVESRTSRFTVSGLAELPADRPFLFISNHRDIALDPAFVNYSLYHNDHDTARIAIGDNLLSKPHVSDLMRLNKCFIVKRSAKAPREMFAASKKLSAYISHSLSEDNSSIWIAQREGRAKDGKDRTEPAIIKMLSMNRQKKMETLAEFIGKLHIVPVAISYELDPCDAAKATELYAKAALGGYQKDEHEDVASIARGIDGEKGHVHVSFGTPLVGEFDDANEVAAAIDQQIISNYVLHSSNYFAYKLLHGEYPQDQFGEDQRDFSSADLKAKERVFQQRIEAMPEAHRPYALGIYANPIVRKQELA